MPEQPSFADVLLSAVSAFDYAGIDTPQMDARLLLSHAAGISHSDLISRMHDLVPHEIQATFSGFVSRRLGSEPVHRILGKREFYGREFLLGPDALVPRPDTETLIDVILQKYVGRPEKLRILDLGTGSGVIAITLACEIPDSDVVAVDISKDVLENCSENALRLGVGDRMQTLYSNMFEKLEGRFDLIVSNPPYIPTQDLEGLAPEVKMHDPKRALDGGADGLTFYRQIFAAAPEFLKQEGTLVVEFGIGQSELIRDIASSCGFSDLSVHQDLGGIARVMVARS